MWKESLGDLTLPGHTEVKRKIMSNLPNGFNFGWKKKECRR